MSPTSIIIIVTICIFSAFFLVVKIVDALSRISRRIEATNTHLDDIHTGIGELAEILSTSLIELHKKQENNSDRLDELEGYENPEYDDGEIDPLLDTAVKIATEFGKISASLLQRRLSIGYARAAKLLDQLEQEGYVGPGEGSKPREIIQQPVKETEETASKS